MEKKKLLELILSSLSESKKIVSSQENQCCCKHYSSKDYKGYLNGSMAGNERSGFENHCIDCVLCLTALHFTNDEMENEALYQKSMKILDGFEKRTYQKISNVFEIVISTAKEAIKVIKTSGEVIQMPSSFAVRGMGEKVPMESIAVIQEFPHISIQIELKHSQDKKKAQINISLMNVDTGDFIGDVKVRIVGNRVDKKIITDLNGQAKYEVNEKGKYQITLVSDSVEYLMKLRFE